MNDLPKFKTLLVECDGDLALLTLDRPDTLNIMNLTMRRELAVFFDWVRQSDVRVLIITGAGNAFCAGGDANDFVERESHELHRLMRDRSHVWFRRMWQLPQPVIAAVNGVAAGGGANLLLGADMVIASEGAKFGETFVRLGLVPDLGAAFLLPRVVGLRKAKRLAMLGRVLDADEALELGIFDEVVASEELLERARDLAKQILTRPADALAAIKSMMNRSFERSMDETLEVELYAQSFIFGTNDFRGRTAAFLQGYEPEGS